MRKGMIAAVLAAGLAAAAAAAQQGPACTGPVVSSETMAGDWTMDVGYGVTMDAGEIDRVLDPTAETFALTLRGQDTVSFAHPEVGEMTGRLGPAARDANPGMPTLDQRLYFADVWHPGVRPDCDPRGLPALQMAGYFAGGGKARMVVYAFGPDLLSGLLLVESGPLELRRLVTLRR